MSRKRSPYPGGEVVAVAASGPSLTAADLELVREAGIPLIVVNDCWRLAPWAWRLYACDYKWWHVHHKAAEAFQGERWTQDKDAALMWGLNYLPGKHDVGLGRDCLHFGDNSGYQAVNLAYLAGARRVLLIGFDMMPDGAKVHWFGSHEGKLKDPVTFDRFIRAFEMMCPENYGLEVINCSRRTALTCFPTARLEDALLQSDTRLPALSTGSV